jgi:hypothetical protein
MARKVDITVDRKGRVRADFVGFPGDDCYDEAENLRRALAHFGVTAASSEVVKKTPAQIESERAETVESGPRPQPVETPGL